MTFQLKKLMGGLSIQDFFCSRLSVGVNTHVEEMDI